MARTIGARGGAIILLILGVFQTIHAYNQEFVSDFLSTLNVVSTALLLLGLAAFAIALWDGSWATVAAGRVLTLAAMLLNVVLTDTAHDSTAIAHIVAYVAVAVVVLCVPSARRAGKE